jgi:TatD DNase family protein
MIDTHVHLEFPDYADEQEAVLDRAAQSGVTRVISVGGEVPRNQLIVELVDHYTPVYGALGIHPHWANTNHPDQESWLNQLLDHPKILAVGEIGLDYYYNYSPRNVQRVVFSRYLEIAENASKPVIVHSRDSFDDTYDILKDHAPINGVVHCFSYSEKEAEAFLSLGLHISFCGQITFKKCEDLRNTARTIPLERLLLETDCPFLAPEPKRGRRNEPAFVAYIAEKHAELRGCTTAEIDEATTRNAERLFRFNTT